MFRFVVTRLHGLSRVPGLPQLFDAALTSWTALTNPPRLAAMEAIEAEGKLRPGVRLKVHRLGGIEFSTDRGELGHLHGNGLLDVFIGRANRDRLVAAGRAQPHHVFPKSGWISFWVNSSADASRAAELLDLAWEARLPSPEPTQDLSAADTARRQRLSNTIKG